jgi:ribA/ribD-fused uncharacterized protein
MKPEDYNYVVKNNLCLFQKGPLSQWWGGFKGQNGGFSVSGSDLYFLYMTNSNNELFTFLEREYMLYSELDFNCCEQWMMACKAALFNDKETFLEIMKESSPAKQKDLGRSVKNYNQDIWDEYKFEIVLRGNYSKFGQNLELKEFLYSFNSFTIFAEASPWDKVWGIGLGPDDPRSLDINTWQGKNLLGRAITDIRQYYGRY